MGQRVGGGFGHLYCVFAELGESQEEGVLTFTQCVV